MEGMGPAKDDMEETEGERLLEWKLTAIDPKETNTWGSGLKVIILEFILRLKIKSNDWLLADRCLQAANHALYFESETVLKFYNL